MNYLPTIGLEIHAELSTKTKMFCDCSNDPQEKHPNINVCPICLGHPGTLPTINKKAVESIIKLGFALGAKLNDSFKFDRKNYFYPDLPKGYQISQHDQSIILGGVIGGFKVDHVHLEEDAGKLIHGGSPSAGSSTEAHSKSSGQQASLVDFNRAGVPLMELVTEPDFHSVKDASAFVKELQLLLRYLDISDADLEKGQMRFDVNVSVRPNDERMVSNSDRIILKEESYRLMGLLFEIHNKLGGVYKEKNYQDAIEAILKREKLPFEREKNITLKFDNLDISNFFADFIIDNKILLEIKATKFITQEDIRQTLRYIKSANVPLGIIVNFRLGELEYKRIINPTFDSNSPSLAKNSSEAPLGTKVEVKNLNSFRALENSLNYEIERQSEILDSGEEIKQETRGWDDVKNITKGQRGKEHTHDYRYFPEPDLPTLTAAGFDVEGIRLSLPELPRAKQERFQNEYNLDSSQANLLVEDRQMAQYFEESVSELEEEEQKAASPEKVKLIFNYLTSDLKGLMGELELDFRNLKITPENFSDLIKLIAGNQISSRVAKDLLKKMQETGLDPREIVKQEGLEQVSGGEELEAVVKKVLEENPSAVADYKKGKTNALQFLVGKAMAALKGRGNPEVLRKLFEESL